MITAARSVEDVRALFPIAATRAYLFAGGIAPISTPCRAALDRWVDRWMQDPAAHRADYFGEWRAIKERFAEIINADADEIAITDGTSRGNNLAVQMIASRPGTNVVVDATTYPSALYPWLLSGRREIEIRRVRTRDGWPVVEDFERLVDDDTIAITVSHVCRLTGFRHDLQPLGALAHAHDALLLVDAAQSVGAIAVDVAADGIDFLAAGAMKWLLGAPGVGFFYVRRDLVESIPPPHSGPVGVKPDLELAPGAARHELNSANFPGVAASLAGIEIVQSVGMDVVQEHVLDLSGYLIDGLLERGIAVRTPPEFQRRAGVVAFTLARPEELQAFARERGVDIWGYRAEDRVRADPHIYNDRRDVDRLLAAIDGFRR